jgi:prepilin-type N-terminal cleavage/methylation domain-containing protein/prepilin-type processing-associated H-X9-DG protein
MSLTADRCLRVARPNAAWAQLGLARAFTLIELLVVMAIMGLLAALLLPAFVRAQEKGRMAKCLSNLHQIGLVVAMYMDDYDSRYPILAVRNSLRGFDYAGGDPAPYASKTWGLGWATNRLLWEYARSPELYHCPADRGETIAACGPKPPYYSLFAWWGTSYQYNNNPWCDVTWLEAKDANFGCAGKPQSWIHDPAHYVLFDEIPAIPYRGDGGWYYFFWHEAGGPTTKFGIGNVKDRFISPVLFADGHATRQDFTRGITSLPDYPCEPQRDYYLYEPLETQQ